MLFYKEKHWKYWQIVKWAGEKHVKCNKEIEKEQMKEMGKAVKEKEQIKE